MGILFVVVFDTCYGDIGVKELMQDCYSIDTVRKFDAWIDKKSKEIQDEKNTYAFIKYCTIIK